MFKISQKKTHNRHNPKHKSYPIGSMARFVHLPTCTIKKQPYMDTGGMSIFLDILGMRMSKVKPTSFTT